MTIKKIKRKVEGGLHVAEFSHFSLLFLHCIRSAGGLHLHFCLCQMTLKNIGISPSMFTCSISFDFLNHYLDFLQIWLQKFICLMPYPCSQFYFDLATDYIQKRRGEPTVGFWFLTALKTYSEPGLLISFESVAKIDIKVKLTTW